MNEIIKTLKKIKLNKKSLGLLCMGVVALALLIMGELPAFSEEESVSVTDTSQYSARYIATTQKELQKMLEKIDGAGQVRVMLTLESCYENIYAKAYDNEKKISESSTDESIAEEYVIVKKGSSNEECLVVKVYEPVVKGVAVVCEGGDNVQVKKAITETVCALFDISSAKVSVSKMNTR